MTYAIFRAAGFQYRAELGDVLRLPSLDAESGDTVTFDQVLLGAADGKVLIGRPTLQGAAVRAEVLRHGRADKIIVFKFKRRKNYRRKSGHRQGFTEIQVSGIDLGGGRQLTAEPARKAAAEPKARKAPAQTAAKATAAKADSATKTEAKAKGSVKAKGSSKSEKKKK